MLTPCAKRCGAKVDPEQLPGGLCRSCFAELDEDTKRRLRTELRAAQDKRLNPRQPRHAPSRPASATRHAKPNRSTNRNSRRGGRAA